MIKSMIRKSTVLVATIALTLLVLLQTASTTVDAVPIPQRDGGLEEVTRPLLTGVDKPLTTGLGRGVAGAGAGTQPIADIFGMALATVLHVIGDVAANTEQGAGQSVANAGSASQRLVEAIKHNNGLAGKTVEVLTG